MNVQEPVIAVSLAVYGKMSVENLKENFTGLDLLTNLIPIYRVTI